MKGLRNWYLPLGSVHRRWTGLFLFSTILLVLGLAAPAAAQMPPSCTETDAAITTTIQKLGLPADIDTTNLVADCTTLLRLKDELRGTGTGSLKLGYHHPHVVRGSIYNTLGRHPRVLQ